MGSFAKRQVLCLLFLPIVVVAIWLGTPWGVVTLLGGIFLFGYYTIAIGGPLTPRVSALAFAISMLFAAIALAIATTKGIPIMAIVGDYSVAKQIWGFPEFAVILLSFSITAAVAGFLRRILTRHGT